MPTRILYLAWAPFLSGAERALLLTVQHLDPARYLPYVLVGTRGDTLDALRAAGIECSHQPLAPLERRHPVAGLQSTWGVIRTARRLGAALIHANDAPSYQPGGAAAMLLRLPTVTHVRFPDTDAGFSWFLRPRPDKVLFVSDALRADSVGACPRVFAGRSDVLHDGVRLPPALPPNRRAELRASLDLPASTPAVALTGQVSEIKGIWEFVEAARLLLGRGITATFTVLGDDLKGKGQLKRDMEDRVSALGLSSSFRFLGFRPDAPSLIPAFDIVTVPSHVEPLGNATLEAMAAGVPVVGSKVGGIPEMVVNGVTGVLVPPRNAPALADALERLIGNENLRHDLGRAARQRAESAFSLEAHAGRLQAIYDDVLGLTTG